MNTSFLQGEVAEARSQSGPEQHCPQCLGDRKCDGSTERRDFRVAFSGASGILGPTSTWPVALSLLESPTLLKPDTEPILMTYGLYPCLALFDLFVSMLD